jgi:hypothetical protein
MHVIHQGLFRLEIMRSIVAILLRTSFESIQQAILSGFAAAREPGATLDSALSRGPGSGGARRQSTPASRRHERLEAGC